MPSTTERPADEQLMQHAIGAAAAARTRTSPNPWVGATLLTADGVLHVGATEPPGGAHAEIVALRAAGAAARGATLATTLEPCGHHGRTGPCTEAIIAAGVQRVLIGVLDPDANVAGTGVEQLTAAGVHVDVGVAAEAVEEQLAPYLHHRRTGRPWVVLKWGASLDGRTAAPDASSRWITSEEARTDAHRLRSESDAIVVGAATVRTDDPTLTTRLVDGPSPRRVVLGTAPINAAVHPCLEWNGTVPDLLDDLGSDGVIQVMVEGGAHVFAQFVAARLVNRVVAYVAPAIFRGDDARSIFTGSGAATIGDLTRGRFVDVRIVGPDLRIEYAPEFPN
ncbi:MAG: bifunctional diaminohydroxyphosphoribosylaminopyrimidine deaminase/5-amino-6-(5-phosphoribosylamino)uracil reductase RibD [Actinomycetota bacterium]